jgi:hypothetical protein
VPSLTGREAHETGHGCDRAARSGSLRGSWRDGRLQPGGLLKATIGDPKYYKLCKAVFVCGTPLASDEGMAGVLNANAAKARQLLQEAGYDGTPVELLQSTDLTVLTNMASVAKAQMVAPATVFWNMNRKK